MRIPSACGSAYAAKYVAIPQISDSEIEQWVLKHLSLLKLAGCREVCVLSSEGIVTLDGTVPNRTAKVAMQKATLTVKGVIGVVNNLQWQPARAAMVCYPSLRSAQVSRGVRPPSARRSVPGRAVSTY